MTSMQKRPDVALPNVLRVQTVPNTLGGVRSTGPASRRKLPVRALIVAVVVILGALAVIGGRLP